MNQIIPLYLGPAGVINSELQHPHLFVPTQPASASPIKIGVVFSGGPASGGRCFMWNAHEIRDQDELIGFCGGPKGLLEGKTNKSKIRCRISCWYWWI